MKSKKIKMLSLDTSTTDSGWAVWLDGKYKRSGHYATDKKWPPDKKQMMMSDFLMGLIDKEKPDIIAVELTSVARNVRTQMRLDRLLGLIEYKAYKKGIFYSQYNPSTWRKLVKGDTKVPTGRENKKAWGIGRVQAIFGIECGNDNTADAILVGYAYLQDLLQLSKKTGPKRKRGNKKNEK